MTLEGWYRRLMLAYPRSFRRGHGEELVTTLLDMAGPDRFRPTVREVVDLLRGGLRQRFRLPTGRTPFIVAVLAALIVGAFGSAAGAWLGWRPAVTLPADPVARSITTTALGQPYTGTFIRREGPLEAGNALVTYAPTSDASWSAVEAHERFTGWRIELGGDGWFTATRDGLRIRVSEHDDMVSVLIYQVEPPWVPAATAAGWLAGAISGWLLVGWAWYAALGRRPQLSNAVQTAAGTLRWSPPLHRHVLVLLSAVSVVALGRPALATYDGLFALYAEPADPRFPKLPAWSWYIWHEHLTTAGLVAVLLAVAVAGASRRQPSTIKKPAT